MNAARAWLDAAVLSIGLLACIPSWCQNRTPVASPLVVMSDGRLMAPDIARVIEQGELVVAMFRTDSPPFFVEKNGVLSGIDVDLARMIGKELGVPVRFDRSSATVDGVVEMVGSGRADLAISRLGRTVKRSQMVLFSTPYLMLGHAMLINRLRLAEMSGDRPIAQVVRGFKGRIGVMANTSWEEYGRRYFPHATIVTFPNWPAVVDAVRLGQVAAAYRDELEVRAVLQRDPGLALTLRTVTFNDAQSALSVMTNVRDTSLLAFVNEVIAARTDKPSVSAALTLIK
jgi:polar amino acid transport system substrate-binding protein